MLKRVTTTKITDQTSGEKMQILAGESRLRLGKRLKFYQKIIEADDSFSFLKRRTLFEQMKATKSALLYTKRNLNKTLRSTYFSATTEVKSRLGSNVELDALPTLEDSKEVPTLSPAFDATIIEWTPLKFILVARQLRDKGRATLRHSEGLITKFLFKVAGFYAYSKNWNFDKLSFYHYKLDHNSDYQEVSETLEPLKKDIEGFLEIYKLLKFGQSEAGEKGTLDGFDDIIKETKEDQIKTLYWHYFIYQGIAHFILKYYMVLVTTAKSFTAIRILSQIFEPIISKSIDVKQVFLGSFETDQNKRKLRVLFGAYSKQQAGIPKSRLIQIREGVFESLNYNIDMLEDSYVTFNIVAPLPEKSPWGEFIQRQFVKDNYYFFQGTDVPENYSEELRYFSLLQILSTCIKCQEYNSLARQKVVDRLKDIINLEKDYVIDKIKDIEKRGESRIRAMKRKLIKMNALKQVDSYEMYERDIAATKKEILDQCESIKLQAKQQFTNNQRRLQHIMKEVDLEKDRPIAVPAKFIYQLVKKSILIRDFPQVIIKFIVKNILEQYKEELESLYENIFYIFEPEIQRKVTLIQALKKAGAGQGANLRLSKEDQAKMRQRIMFLRSRINEKMPGIFEIKVILGVDTFPIGNLIRIGINLQSLKLLLSLKASIPNKPPVLLPVDMVKSILILNSVQNPVPQHTVLLEGLETGFRAEKAINRRLLKTLNNNLSTQKTG